jgi:hypothetical protein
MRPGVNSLHRLLSHPFTFPHAALSAALHCLDALIGFNTMYLLIQVE